MAAATLTAPTFAFAPAKTWFMPVTYLQRNADGSVGAPVDLSGGVVSGVLFTRGNLVGLPLTVSNGGVTVNPTNGVMNFLVSESITAGFVADDIPPFADYYNYPTRIEIDFRDTLGHLDVAAVFPIFVFDPRFVDPSTLPTQQAGTIVSGGQQGLPGATGITSINGYTNAIVTLGAHDVGTYTRAEVDAKIQAVMGAAFFLRARSTIKSFEVVRGVGNALIDIASSDTPADMGNVLGIVSADAPASSLAPIANGGVLENAAWSWMEGPIYLGIAGAMTQSEPTVGFVQQIGIAVGPTTIVVGLLAPEDLTLTDAFGAPLGHLSS